MAFGKITFENLNTGSVKEAPIGFSWTTLFFGPFPAFLRGHIGVGFVILILAFLTGGFATIIFGFIYNKMYVKNLISQGFKMIGSTHPPELMATKLALQIPSK